MTDHDAFVHTICERTAQGLDTTAERLVFADWLEEHAGDCPYPDAGTQGGMKWRDNGYAERAEFIRVQCELAGLHQLSGMGPAVENRRQQIEILRLREGELLNEWPWRPPPLNELVPFGPGMAWKYHCTFRRGFVAKVRCSFREWCGEACYNCEGTGELDAQTPHQKCHGTGRIGAIGPAIVACCPIEEFSSTDVRPDEDELFPWGRYKTRAHSNRRALEWAREKWLERREE